MENETENEREVFAISRDQVALCSLNRGMTGCLAGGGKPSRCRLGFSRRPRSRDVYVANPCSHSMLGGWFLCIW